MLANTYRYLPLSIDHGNGCFLYDKSNTAYLDMFAGLSVNALGYGHPRLQKALQQKSQRYLHISNYFLDSDLEKLAQTLCEKTFAQAVFFGNSGSEANEAAIKAVRLFFGNSRTEIVTFSGSFHGRTMGSLSLTANPKHQHGFAPLLPQIHHLPFNDVDALANHDWSQTAAIFMELIQGENGVVPIEPSFLNKLLQLRDQFGFLLIIDEIQTGLGRCGSLFLHEHFDFVPDAITTAKSLGGGLPLSALLLGEKMAHLFQPGIHGSTFGGNPLAAALGNVVLAELENELLDNVRRQSSFLMSQLKEWKQQFPHKIQTVRGRGLMIGIVLNEAEPESVKNFFLTHHILINFAGQNTLRLLPPLIIQQAQLEMFLVVLNQWLTAPTPT